MKILAIIGSPRGKGNTYRTVRQAEECLRSLDSSLEMEYLFLKDAGLGTCKGCYLCFLKGEDSCPIKDGRADIEKMMENADGVIFATPVYAYNVSWIMKNFIDRFAYVCHRPRFHGKKAMIVATTGAVGLVFTTLTLGFEIGTWGFKVSSRLGVMHPAEEIRQEQRMRLEKKTISRTAKACRKFHDDLTDKGKPDPGFISILSFRLQKDAFSRKSKDLADYRYWKGKGWLEDDARYYCEAKSSLLKYPLASLVAWIMSLMQPEPSGEN
ncbi:NAD(P)H-dependent oxidoreductase [Youngiibacter fragilis]|uniref:NADPH-dependent FMN reductase n=1 Tax=Youngiibacter fragilis 232.1 TaxID=994573 RepID=V7HZB0_9CLOT|nr:flavodoxin family protein [Youngiibacter fragilis]ETA78968.1 NADPH-dependent FMN reductase [Youngiibacter fragilis 232.1]